MKTIQLTQGKETKICDCHYDLVKEYTWHYSGSNGYATSRKRIVACPCGCTKAVNLFMHRLVNNTPEGMLTDHINRDRLDNRCENLRSVTDSENQRNKGGYGVAGYKGVRFVKKAYSKPWRAYSDKDDKGGFTYLGAYSTAEEASAAVIKFTETGELSHKRFGRGKSGEKYVKYDEKYAERGWKPWQAFWSEGLKGKAIYLGRYATKQEAVRTVREYERTGVKPMLHKGNPNHINKKQEKICERCGKKFLVSPSQALKRRWCSYPCYNLDRKK